MAQCSQTWLVYLLSGLGSCCEALPQCEVGLVCMAGGGQGRISEKTRRGLMVAYLKII